MNFTITKLDRRHAWHDHFAYMIEFHRKRDWDYKATSGVLDFDQARRWLTQTYGWSQDVDTRMDVAKALIESDVTKIQETLNRHWAYSCRYQEYRVYLAEDQELTMFKLKWSADATA